LRAQKNAEDESYTIAFNNLRIGVIKLRNEALEKDKILLTLVDKVKKDEANFKTQSEAQKIEIEDLRKQLAKAKEKCAVAEAKRGISEQWTNHLEKNVEELRISKERCFEKSMDCVKKIKTSFTNVGAYSSEDNIIRGDPEGPIEWISSEAEAFEEVLSGRGDVCAFSGARGVAAILEKAGCEHVKTLAQAKAAFSIDDTKDPSAEASLIGGKIFTDIWENGGRGMAHDIIKKSEKDTHDTREATKTAEKAAELERRIGINDFYLCCLLLRLRNNLRFLPQLNYLLPQSPSSHWPKQRQKNHQKLLAWLKLL
jgi:cell division septum initiation protein DivIVA